MQWTSGGHSSIIDHQKVTAAEIIVIDKQVETTFKFGTKHVTQSRLGTHGHCGFTNLNRLFTGSAENTNGPR